MTGAPRPAGRDRGRRDGGGREDPTEATDPAGTQPAQWWDTGAGLAALLGGGVVLVAALVWVAVWFTAARAGQVASSGATTAVDTYGLGLIVLVLASAGYLALLAAVLVERVRRRADRGSPGAGEVG